MTKNNNLIKAKKAANDEFYTMYKDIENEMQNYKDHFKGKVVYCNCDTENSNFFKYFQNNFAALELKQLIRSSLNDGVPFQSDKGIELLKQSDIVVTNPPFSLFRDFVGLLVEYDKKFIILGGNNVVTYKEIFKLIKEDKLWLGCKSMNSDILFDVTNEYAEEMVKTKKEGSAYKIVNGIIKARVQASWFSNLEHKKRNEPLLLTKTYKGNEASYPKYDNYDAIEVSKTKDIPIDYFKVIGVPISWLDKYNPEQFKILGLMNTGEENKGIRHEDSEHGRPLVNGVEKYLRILIKSKEI